jgi:hypothetical protein
LIAEGDKVVARNLVTGTQQGEFRGRPATGEPVAYDEIFIFRFADGRVAESWGIAEPRERPDDSNPEDPSLPKEAAPIGVAVARAARCEAARAGSTDHGGRDDVTYPRIVDLGRGLRRQKLGRLDFGACRGDGGGSTVAMLSGCSAT